MGIQTKTSAYGEEYPRDYFLANAGDLKYDVSCTALNIVSHPSGIPRNVQCLLCSNR